MKRLVEIDWIKQVVDLAGREDSELADLEDLGLSPLDPEVSFVWDATKRGLPLIECEGWRYGAAPEVGASYDYRDGRLLSGVSMMEVVVADTGEVVRPNTILPMWVFEAPYSHRPIRRYRGFYAGRGSEGEPLLAVARPLN